MSSSDSTANHHECYYGSTKPSSQKLIAYCFYSQASLYPLNQSLKCSEMLTMKPEGETMMVNFEEPVSTTLLADSCLGFLNP